ncbi:MAG: prolipoprotein diacylglyceryl transferase family protein [Pirellulales bacterium]
MRQTLFYIPVEVFGIPLFGFGLLLVVWALATIALVVYLVRKQGFNADTKAYLPVLGLLGLFIYALPLIVGEERGLPIRGYGVMLLLAVSSAVGLLVYRAKRRGYDPELMLSLSFWLFLAGIVGARLFYVIEYWEPQFHKDTLAETLAAVFNITQGGLVVFGSLIGGAIAALIFIARHRLPVLTMGDLMAPSIVLGMAVGRIGCFFNGCCFGGACELPWAVQFPFGSPPHIQQVEQGKLTLHGLQFKGGDNDPAAIASVESDSLADRAGLVAGQQVTRIVAQPPGSERVREWKVDTVSDALAALLHLRDAGTEVRLRVTGGSDATSETLSWTLPDELPRSIPIHPTQIYSAIDGFLLLFVLLAYEPFQRRSGELLALLLTLHPISRFLLEVIRIDEASMFGTGLSISQLISIIALAGAAVLWTYILRQPRQDIRAATA